MQFGVVIVSYNSAEVLEGCIRACQKWPGADVLVIDNASRDEPVQRATECGARVIANRTNRGFAAAVNQGFRELPHEAILILNPDCAPLSGLEEMASAVTKGEVGAVGGILLGPDGAPQEGFQVRSFPMARTLVFEILGLNRVFPFNPVNRRYRNPVISETGEGDQPAGAFLMVRRSAWSDVGGFDENFYPIWFEDVDFCLRLRKEGWLIRHCREARAQHLGGHSAHQLSWGSRQHIWYENLLRYSGKHFSRSGQIAVALAVAFGLLARVVVHSVSRQTWAPYRVYTKILRAVWLTLSKRKVNKNLELAVSIRTEADFL